MSHAFCQQIKIDQLDAIKIEHPLFNATLLLQGAQLIEFSPENNQCENILWLSPSAQYKQGQPIRGGIPICWPWFGNLDKNPSAIQEQIPTQSSAQGLASAHGFARAHPWNIISIYENCHYVEVTLALTSSQESKILWPFDFELEARFTFSKTMTLALTTKNQDDKPFSISQALHTYLPTQDIKHSFIYNTHNLDYIDALDNWKRKRQSGSIQFSAETDRLYFFKTADYALRLDTPKQSLLINNKNSQSAVIWNPWIEKSKILSQFDPLDYQNMLCIETANVLGDLKEIKAGDKTTLSVELIACH